MSKGRCISPKMHPLLKIVCPSETLITEKPGGISLNYSLLLCTLKIRSPFVCAFQAQSGDWWVGLGEELEESMPTHWHKPTLVQVPEVWFLNQKILKSWFKRSVCFVVQLKKKPPGQFVKVIHSTMLVFRIIGL